MKHQLKIGDLVAFRGCRDGRGSHGATAIVQKINRKSICVIEREGSYRAGKEWHICAGVEIAVVDYGGSRVDKERGLINGLRRDFWGKLGERGLVED